MLQLRSTYNGVEWTAQGVDLESRLDAALIDTQGTEWFSLSIHLKSSIEQRTWPSRRSRTASKMEQSFVKSTSSAKGTCFATACRKMESNRRRRSLPFTEPDHTDTDLVSPEEAEDIRQGSDRRIPRWTSI